MAVSLKKQHSCNENDACKMNILFDEIGVKFALLSGHQLFMQDIKHLGNNINTDFTAKHSSRGYLTPNKSSESRATECKVTPGKTNSMRRGVYFATTSETSGSHYHDHYLPVLQSVN